MEGDGVNSEGEKDGLRAVLNPIVSTLRRFGQETARMKIWGERTIVLSVCACLSEEKVTGP